MINNNSNNNNIIEYYNLKTEWRYYNRNIIQSGGCATGWKL